MNRQFAFDFLALLYRVTRCLAKMAQLVRTSTQCWHYWQGLLLWYWRLSQNKLILIYCFVIIRQIGVKMQVIAKLLARQTLKSSWASKSSCLTCLILPVTRLNRSHHIWYENFRGKSVWQFVALQDLLSIWHWRI